MEIKKDFENTNSFHHWFLIAAISGKPVTEKMKEKPRVVTMQLNGEEIDAVQAIKRMEQEFDDQVKRKALQLFKDNKRDIFEPLEEKVDEMMDNLEEIFKKKIERIV